MNQEPNNFNNNTNNGMEQNFNVNPVMQEPVINNSVPNMNQNQNFNANPVMQEPVMNNINNSVPNMNQNQNFNVNPIMQEPVINNINSNIPNNTKLPQKSNKALIAIIIGVVVILIVAVVIFVITTNKTKKNTSNNNDIRTTQKEIDNKNNEEKTTTKKQNTSSQKNDSASTSISTDWKSGEFQLEGVNFKINSDYSDLVSQGWSVDFTKYKDDNGFILKPNTKVLSTLRLENSKYEDARIYVGFINRGTTDKHIKECQFWAIDVDNQFSDTPLSFVLPGGIKNGSTKEEIEKVYGVPEADNIYRSSSSNYTEYTYEYEYSIKFRLTIFDDGGLKGFEYKFY